MDEERPKVYEGYCQDCGEWAWVILGLCGDCAPASYHHLYEEWWNSPEGQVQRMIMTEQVLSELALEQADHDQLMERGENGKNSP